MRATLRRVRCQHGPTELYRAGQAYELAAGEFHQTLPPTEPTATVALGRNRPGVIDRILAPFLTSPRTSGREVYSIRSSRRIAGAVATRLGQPVRSLAAYAESPLLAPSG
jgi:hypothetical protein